MTRTSTSSVTYVPVPLTPSKLRADVYRILDRVLATGEPVQVVRKGRRLVISPVEGADLPTGRRRRRLEDFGVAPSLIVGNPEDLVEVDWSQYWDPDRATDP